jgi:hypothetical protein
MFGWDFGISTMYWEIRVFYACRIVNCKRYWYALLSEDLYYICSFSIFQKESSPYRSSQHTIISMKVIVLSHLHDFYRKVSCV